MQKTSIETPEHIIATLFAKDAVLRGLPRIIAYMINLPHRTLRPEEVWIKQYEEFSLVVEPVRSITHEKPEGEFFSVPFGPRARMLFAHFIAQSIGNTSGEVDKGDISDNQWLKELGLSIGGQTYQTLREQILRLSSSRFVTTFCTRGYEGATWDSFHTSGMRCDAPKHRPTHAYRDMVRLNSTLFADIADHPTRISPKTVAQLSNQSLGLDIYFWLAYRLPLVSVPEEVSWNQLFRCFGGTYKELHHFQPWFQEKLKIALNLYTGAAVSLTGTGILLESSPPPRESQ